MRGRVVTGLAAKIAPIALAIVVLGTGAAFAGGGAGNPGGAVPEPAKPGGTKPSAAKASDPKTATSPPPAIVGNFGQWALVCGKLKDGKEACSLVQALVERDSKKLVFRIVLAYGPQGNLVLRVDSPTGVALQRGLEFSTGAEPTDASKIYRLPFQTCVAEGCRAMLVLPEDLKGELKTSAKGTLRVFTLEGRAVQTGTDLTGLTEGLAALDKRRQAQVN